MSNIKEIFNEFKTKVEKEQFLVKQHETITSLMQKNADLEKEVAHLKSLLTSTQLIISEQSVEKIIPTPEEELINTQISLLNLRCSNSEITLEDAKKLDLLLKNKQLLKNEKATIQGESKKIDKTNYSKAELISIAKKGPSDAG